MRGNHKQQNLCLMPKTSSNIVINVNVNLFAYMRILNLILAICSNVYVMVAHFFSFLFFFVNEVTFIKKQAHTQELSTGILKMQFFRKTEKDW